MSEAGGRASRRGWLGAGLTVLALLGAALAAARWMGGDPGIPAAFAGGLTLASAEARSAEVGRPVLVLASASWCGACRSFKRGALRDEDLGRLIAERTVGVYVDVDQDRAGAGRLGVYSIPALVLMREGRVVSRLEGSRPAAEVRAWLEESTSGGGR